MASLGSTPGLIIAAGVGAAASVALEPAFEVPKQDAWARLPNRIIGIGTLARLVAQGGVLLGNPDGSTAGSAYGEARRQGFGADKLDRLVWLELHAPDLSLTLELWRRGLLGPPTSDQAIALVDHALAKEQIEPRYWPGIKELFSARLDPALIATMVQRSVLPNAWNADHTEQLLPFSAQDAIAAVYDEWAASTRAQLGTDPPTGNLVPPMPAVDLDPIEEARAHGITFDRLAAETRIVGLPASPDLAARMVYRGIATPADFVQAVLEGNARAEWAPSLFQAFREILTAGQYAELQLRGFSSEKERRANTLKHGMSEADSDLLYNLLGRSIPVHQIITGEARGGTFGGPIDTIPRAILSSLQRGNLRPEFYNLAHANRYSYPSAFFFRLLISTGEITAAEGEQAFLEIGWSPKWAKLIAQALAPVGATAKADPWVTKARNQLWTAIHKGYLNGELDRAGADSKLDTLIPDLATRNEVLDLWTIEDESTTKPLTPAAIKKAYKGNDFTLDEAAARLVAQQWAPADAQVYLTT